MCVEKYLWPRLREEATDSVQNMDAGKTNREQLSLSARIPRQKDPCSCVSACPEGIV
jgi:hypothetical protein